MNERQKKRQLRGEATFLLVTDADLWQRYVNTIPRTKTINLDINELIQKAVELRETDIPLKIAS